MYIYILHIHIYIYQHIHIYIRTCIYMYTYMSSHIYTYIYLQIRIYTLEYQMPRWRLLKRFFKFTSLDKFLDDVEATDEFALSIELGIGWPLGIFFQPLTYLFVSQDVERSDTCSQKFAYSNVIQSDAYICICTHTCIYIHIYIYIYIYIYTYIYIYIRT